MGEQLPFEFIEPLPPRPSKPERVFLAVLAGVEKAAPFHDAGERLREECDLDGGLLAPERMHISLVHIRDATRLRSVDIFAARLAADGVSLGPFDVTFRCAATFENHQKRKPFVLLGDEGPICHLHRTLAGGMLRNGFRVPEIFTPHLTLLYDRKLVPPQAIRPIALRVEDFVLIHSRRWLSQYHVLGRWPLQPH